MFWFLIATAAAAPPALPEVRPCATLEMLPLAPALRVPESPPAAGAKKQEHTPYGLPNSERTQNFRISWGDSGSVRTSEIDNLAVALEDSWSTYIDAQEHPQPSGTDAWLFNVFIGDTGSGAPDGYGSAGYYSVDPDGWPMIVVSAGTLNDEDYLQITAAHEFYHAIQGSLGTYDYQGASAWFWEATATWGSAQVYPDNIYYASFLFAYALLPHYPVNFFDYPDTGLLQEYYQYGSYIWPYYLSEFVADESLIRDAWTDSQGESDPLEALRTGLSERDIELDEAWLDHIAFNQVMDYPHGSMLSDWVSSYASHYPEGDNLIAAEHSSQGTGGWEASPDILPRRYGSNAIHMDGPVDGQLHVYIEGEQEGDESSEALWGARLVIVDSDDSYEILEVTFDGGWGELSTDAAANAQELWLVVGAWTETLVNSRWEDEEFDYRYAILVDETLEPTPDTGEPEESEDTDEAGNEGMPELTNWSAGEDPEIIACGCAHSPPSRGYLALVLGFIGFAGRRHYR